MPLKEDVKAFRSQLGKTIGCKGEGNVYRLELYAEMAGEEEPAWVGRFDAISCLPYDELTKTVRSVVDNIKKTERYVGEDRLKEELTMNEIFPAKLEGLFSSLDVNI